jgi:hypothetical protein
VNFSAFFDRQFACNYRNRCDAGWAFVAMAWAGNTDRGAVAALLDFSVQEFGYYAPQVPRIYCISRHFSLIAGVF